MRDRLPVRQGMFLTHGEEETRAAFKQALVAAGCDGSKIFLPQLDDSFDLMAAAIRAPKERRLPPEVVGRHDWHNRYAALVLDLRQRLDALPDDRARDLLLAQVRKTLLPAGRSSLTTVQEQTSCSISSPSLRPCFSPNSATRPARHALVRRRFAPASRARLRGGRSRPLPLDRHRRGARQSRGTLSDPHFSEAYCRSRLHRHRRVDAVRPFPGG